jgi:hypothetical protein
MFDNDLNPEGFTEKFSFDMARTGMLKNVTFQGIQMLFNEVGGGRDSYAVGGQFLTKFKPISRWTVTPSYTLLAWDRVDAIANAAFPVAVCTSATTTFCQPQAVTPAAGAILPIPVTTPPASLANGMTNATRIFGTGSKKTRGYLSRFTYSDLIVDNVITTPWWNKRLPIHIQGEYEKNLQAATNRDAMAVGVFEVGQQKEKHDFLFGYNFNNTNQDAVISSFAESDNRAPTNVINHRIYAAWAPAKNITMQWTWFHGRVQDATLNCNGNTVIPASGCSNLVSPLGTPGSIIGLQQNALIGFPLTGFGAFNPQTMKDPWLNRMQFDVIYKF